jgi:uncharacterized DUF497 family protein
MISFFERDRAKARSNVEMHGVSFEDAMAVFKTRLPGSLLTNGNR